jgi:hypothetical protein
LFITPPVAKAGNKKTFLVAIAVRNVFTVEVFLPDPERHAIYRDLYEQGYLRLQKALRHHFSEKEKGVAEYE